MSKTPDRQLQDAIEIHAKGKRGGSACGKCCGSGVVDNAACQRCRGSGIETRRGKEAHGADVELKTK